MKKYEKILTISLFFTLCLITISSANAAENNTDLGKLISTTATDSEIQLGKGIYKTNVTNINIDKNITIIGKGADKTIIDAQQQGRIFNIKDNGTLTLINLKLINGKSNEGGAIYNNGTLTISHCKFTNNKAMRMGGAISNRDSGSFSVTNSEFTNNLAEDNGGAIYSIGSYDISVINSTFNNNTSKNEGGAIFYLGDWDKYAGLIVINSLFINNNAEWNGGAITGMFADECIVINCTFINNTATQYTSAINNQYCNNFTITNSTFINNIAKNDGATIYSLATNIVMTI